MYRFSVAYAKADFTCDFFSTNCYWPLAKQGHKSGLDLLKSYVVPC